jgi:hypothetical protein
LVVGNGVGGPNVNFGSLASDSKLARLENNMSENPATKTPQDGILFTLLSAGMAVAAVWAFLEASAAGNISFGEGAVLIFTAITVAASLIGLPLAIRAVRTLKNNPESPWRLIAWLALIFHGLVVVGLGFILVWMASALGVF